MWRKSSRQENHVGIRAFMTPEMNFYQKNRRTFTHKGGTEWKTYKREFGKEQVTKKTDLSRRREKKK